MTWVKQNYDRFLLALFALILLACAGVLFNNARSFSSVFDNIRTDPRQGAEVPRPKLEVVDQNIKELSAPQEWQARMIEGARLPVFVSVPYISDGKNLVNPLSGNVDLHPPVPNKWLLEHNQDLLSTNVLEQDSDGDGFSTLDEWNGTPKTDPTNKNEHPPYYTKMFLEKIIKYPFRFIFAAKNGDNLLINAVDQEDAPTRFMKIGQVLPDTKYKVTKYEQKSAKEGNIVKDVSEVTLTNTENGEVIVLPKGKEVNSPKTYAVINYAWNGNKFGVTKNVEFTNKPEENIKYKCLELNDENIVVLRETDNKKFTVTKQGTTMQ